MSEYTSMDAGKSEPTAVTTGYGTAPVATATAVPTANATATATATATADGVVDQANSLIFQTTKPFSPNYADPIVRAWILGLVGGALQFFCFFSWIYGANVFSGVLGILLIAMETWGLCVGHLASAKLRDTLHNAMVKGLVHIIAGVLTIIAGGIAVATWYGFYGTSGYVISAGVIDLICGLVIIGLYRRKKLYLETMGLLAGASGASAAPALV